MPFIRAYLRNKVRNLWRCRGFFKDPVVCSGVFLIIFFVIFIASSKPVTNADSHFLNTLAPSGTTLQGAFIEPDKNFIKNSPEITFAQGNSVIRTSLPNSASGQTLGSLTGSGAGLAERNEIIEYTVETGDTLSSLAEKFGISLNTILWANNLKKGTPIKPDQKLIILPVSGVIYHVKKGDTLSQVVKTYKGKIDEVVAFNELADENDVFVGDILVIPNGVMPSPVQRPSDDSSRIPLASSYFICPLSACRITQGLHWYNAIDFGAKCGDHIYAAAAGTVQKVKFGWNNGSGNYLTILHPNGIVSFYGHLSAALVSPGQSVSQGDTIGLVGGQPGTPGAGKSTGCHLHFTVIGARNPFVK